MVVGRDKIARTCWKYSNCIKDYQRFHLIASSHWVLLTTQELVYRHFGIQRKLLNIIAIWTYDITSSERESSISGTVYLSKLLIQPVSTSSRIVWINFVTMRWASSWTRRPPGPMASSGSSFWIRCGRTWYVTWYCLVYRLHFYVVTMSKILKENSTVFSRIGDTNKLSAFFPCKPLTLVGGSLSCLRLFTSSKLTIS